MFFQPGWPEAASIAATVSSGREFGSRQRARRIHAFIAGQMRQMGPEGFVQMLRPAIKQNERLLFLHGCVLCVAAGSCTWALLVYDVGMASRHDEPHGLPVLAPAAGGGLAGLDRVRRGDPPLVISGDLVDRVRPYLTNLNRQGLVTFSKETVTSPDRYHLIEAQPDVAEALRRAGRASKIIYRSSCLTTFGRDSCQARCPLD
jgi:hypothetical protein